MGGLLLRASVYPALTGGAVALAWVLGRAGLPAPLVLGAMTLAVIPLVMLLERWLPFSAEWAKDRGDGAVDWLHLVLTGRFFDLGVAAPWGVALLVRGTSAPGRWWPSGWPVAAQVVLALLLSELAGYALHRAQHTVPWLWRFHRVHHGSTRLYFLNTARNHPVDALMSGALTALPVALAGPGAEVLLLVGAFSVAHALLQHSNIDLRLGPLNRLLSGPEAHRWHHSTDPAEALNYGQIFLIYDSLLGTFFRPADRAAPGQIGLANGERMEESYLAQLRSPWAPAAPSP